MPPFNTIFWLLMMVGLVASVVVFAMKEKKARKKLAAEQAQPGMDDPAGFEHFGDENPAAADDFGGGEVGDGEFGDGFGEPADFAEADEGALK